MQFYFYSSVSRHNQNLKIKVTSINLGSLTCGSIYKIVKRCIWQWNLAISKVPEVAHTLSFYCTWFKLSLIFTLRVRTLKLPYLGLKFGHWPKLHIHSLSTPRGQNWAYFRSTGSGSRDMGQFSKLPCLAMKLGHWQKFQQFHIYSSFHPNGLKLNLFFALWAAISEIQAHFQNGNIWASNLASCTHILFLPQGVEIELIFTLWAAVSETQDDFQNCHIWV